MIEGDGVGKKALIGVSLAVLATVGVVGGKVYMNNNDNKIENIVKSDEAKEATEKMLKEQDVEDSGESNPISFVYSAFINRVIKG